MNGTVIEEIGLVLDRDDNVATALEDVPVGRKVEYDGETVTVDDDVPFGHKFALTALPTGSTVRKYGEVIGRTTCDVTAGEWVHTHNCESTRGRGDIAPTEEER